MYITVGIASIQTLKLLYIIMFMSNYRWGMEWILDLLTTYTHDSELQAITALLLISTIHRS
jgi:hypothetical protein